MVESPHPRFWLQRLNSRWDRWLLQGVRPLRIAGVWVYTPSDEGRWRDFHREKLTRALALLERTEERRLRRLRRHARRIVVRETGTAGSFSDDLPAIFVRGEALAWNDVGDVASILVHEATHARLRDRGIPYDTPECRARVERACIREQMRFVARLPRAEERRQALEETLETRWWTDEARLAAVDDQLAELRVPKPLRSLLRLVLERLVADRDRRR